MADAVNGFRPRRDGDDHPLDRVIWRALTGRQKQFAIGDAFARRYVADVAPFAAVADEKPGSYRALLRLAPPGDRLALFTPEEVSPPPEFTVVKRDLVDQMILVSDTTADTRTAIIDLTTADLPEMRALVELTKPGPFGPQTIELGRYLGVRVDGTLVAMVGERMRIEGFTEISAVCVHPGSRGQGLAAELIRAISSMIAQGGDTAFLHVFTSNAPAIALYRKLGFTVRRRMHLAVLKTAALN